MSNPEPDAQPSSSNACDQWCIDLGVSSASFQQRAESDASEAHDNSSQRAGVGPGNWGRGSGQDYRGAGGANEPGPNNPVKVPSGETDTGPDTEPQTRIKIDPDAEPDAPTNPSPTLRSPEYTPPPKGPPKTPFRPPPAPPKAPPSDGSPPTLRSPGNELPEELPKGPGAGKVGLGTVGALATGEVLLTGAIVVVGVAEITGAIYQIVMGWGIADLAQSYTPSVEAAKAGFKAGMTRGQSPGDRFGQLGYTLGSRNYEALFLRAKQANPQATADAIKSAIVAKADEALNQVAGALDQGVRSGMWDGYLAAHPSALSGDTARWAYVACFGEEPNSANPDAHWKKYLVSHQYLSWMSPK